MLSSGAGRVQAGVAGSPSVTGVTSPPVGENARVARTSPFGERAAALLRQRARQGGEGTGARHMSCCCAGAGHVRAACRFPLCHWRDISPGGGECACVANLSLQVRGLAPTSQRPAGRRGNRREDTLMLLCVAQVHGTRSGCSAGSPSVTGVTSPPVGENARVARTSPFGRGARQGGEGTAREDMGCCLSGAGRVQAALLPVPPLSLA